MHWLKQRTISAAWVFCGSAAGGGLRFALQGGGLVLLGPACLPVLTVVINLTASSAMGWVIARSGEPNPPHESLRRNAVRRIFWGTGFCGGFSSFSLFTIDWLALANEPILAFLYIVGSVFAGLAGFRLAGRKRRITSEL
jgi:CrcB protein